MFPSIYFFFGFVSGVYTGQEFNLPKFKPILHLIYYKLKQYFEKLELPTKFTENEEEMVSHIKPKEYSTKTQPDVSDNEEINEVFTRPLVSKKTPDQNQKKD